MLTKKHFNAFAAAIRADLDEMEAQFHASDISADTFKGLRDGLGRGAYRFAELSAESNPNFDHKRFMEACGFESY